MEKVCGYKDNTGRLYGSEQEAEYSNLMSELNILSGKAKNSLLQVRVGVNTRWEAEDWQIKDIIDSCKAVLECREKLKNINITAEPKPIGIINKIFKKW
jgi:hypothetical protein